MSRKLLTEQQRERGREAVRRYRARCLLSPLEREQSLAADRAARRVSVDLDKQQQRHREASARWRATHSPKPLTEEQRRKRQEAVYRWVAKARAAGDPRLAVWSSRQSAKSRARKRLLLDVYKLTIGCMDCGYRQHPGALEFDHRPGTVKSFTIGSGSGGFMGSLERLIAEIEKCDVVCANCHRVRTASRRMIS